MAPVIDFWFEFASTYSYPAAMRTEALAARRGVAVHWRPFLLGPIFAGQGLKESPFNLYPVKGAYMWRDVERICASLDLPFRKPDVFPQNGLLGARVATALDDATRPAFVRALYTAEFANGATIADVAVVEAVLHSLGIGAGPVLARANGDEVKSALRASVDEAIALSVFGAPAFTTLDGELFWGNDRLEQALDWALAAAGERAGP
ncbi:MAG: 2-hydroxychromene-2-carboxylate isomerase [Caulobacterales bacterium]|jgi:2-hydroxychromene-2-carboxylate isomerase